MNPPINRSLDFFYGTLKSASAKGKKKFHIVFIVEEVVVVVGEGEDGVLRMGQNLVARVERCMMD